MSSPRSSVGARESFSPRPWRRRWRRSWRSIGSSGTPTADGGAKYPKAVTCLTKDREELLAFYSFPAEQWKHLRTTNPIESTFATVKLRTAKTRGCLSRTTALTMVFQLCLSAQKRWRKLDGYELLSKVIEGVRFIDGVEEVAA